jgi:hypothetical protein
MTEALLCYISNTSDSVRRMLNSLQDRFNFASQQVHFIVHFEKLCVRVVSHLFEDCMSGILFLSELDSSLYLLVSEVFDVVSGIGISHGVAYNFSCSIEILSYTLLNRLLRSDFSLLGIARCLYSARIVSWKRSDHLVGC